MCLITFAYKAHTNYNLILIANRDEFYRRPTRAAAPWPEDADLIAGQDLEQGGTWLGIHRHGRLSAVTNYRDGTTLGTSALRSRGHLTRDYLLSGKPSFEYSQRYAAQGALYGGFNLLMGDSHGLYYLSNRGRDPENLGPGVYGLSNALLDTPWPKLRQARDALASTLNSATLDARQLVELLGKRSLPTDAELPDTGIGLDRERNLASCFIQLPEYGTRATTVILQDYQGNTHFHEQSFDTQGPTAIHAYHIQMPLIGGT